MGVDLSTPAPTKKKYKKKSSRGERLQMILKEKIFIFRKKYLFWKYFLQWKMLLFSCHQLPKHVNPFLNVLPSNPSSLSDFMCQTQRFVKSWVEFKDMPVLHCIFMWILYQHCCAHCLVCLTGFSFHGYPCCLFPPLSLTGLKSWISW